MTEVKFTASKSRSQGREGWCIIFRHPMRQDSYGKAGLRVRRGLGTKDEAEADRLVDQMNEILGNESYWEVGARDQATRQFDQRIISAFYDEIETRMVDPWTVRDEVIGLPGPPEGYARVLFIGTTGAGKTTLVRQLIGSDPKQDRFPSTSAAKTTACDMEIVLSSSKFRSVVTFLSEYRVRQYVEECIASAVLARDDGAGTKDVMRKFLMHAEQRFRLSYILGSPQLGVSSDDQELSDEDGSEENEADEESLIPTPEREQLTSRLREYLDRVDAMAERCKKELRQELDITDEAVTSSERNTLQELLEDYLRQDGEFHSLADDVVDDISTRFDLLKSGECERDRRGWPRMWTFETQDRTEFIKAISRFSSNYAPNFGRLLTPLVQGIRIVGPFQPTWLHGEALQLVLMDGEGLGHTPDSSSSLPTEITKRYEKADAIVLVDSAAQPMQAAPCAVLRSLAASGHESKLIICFTHFDEIKGDNLIGTSARKDHVHSSLDNALAGVGKVLGQSVEKSMSRLLGNKVFYLSNIQEPLSPKADLTHSELAGLVKTIQKTIEVPEPAGTTPVYDEANLILCIQRATQQFHEPWTARLGFGYLAGVEKEHWARVKALSRRLAEMWADEYDTLRPVADLITRLSEHINNFLTSPLRWEPPGAPEEKRQTAIDAVAREMFKHIHLLASKRVFKDRVKAWNDAYSRRGPGSTYVRAQNIQSIYNLAAPIPGETPSPDANAFLNDIRVLVREAVKFAGAKMVNQ